MVTILHVMTNIIEPLGWTARNTGMLFMQQQWRST